MLIALAVVTLLIAVAAFVVACVAAASAARDRDDRQLCIDLLLTIHEQIDAQALGGEVEAELRKLARGGSLPW